LGVVLEHFFGDISALVTMVLEHLYFVDWIVFC
jgi:hypothetical protein